MIDNNSFMASLATKTTDHDCKIPWLSLSSFVSFLCELLLILRVFVLEHVIKSLEEKEGLQLNGINKQLVYVDDVVLLGDTKGKHAHTIE